MTITSDEKRSESDSSNSDEDADSEGAVEEAKSNMARLEVEQLMLRAKMAQKRKRYDDAIRLASRAKSLRTDNELSYGEQEESPKASSSNVSADCTAPPRSRAARRNARPKPPTARNRAPLPIKRRLSRRKKRLRPIPANLLPSQV